MQITQGERYLVISGQCKKIPKHLLPYLTYLVCDGTGLCFFPKSATRLEHLQLFDNKLTKIPRLTKFMHLKILYLAHNQLTELPKLKLKHLKQLDISHNSLTRLPETKHLKRLKYLHASGNKITVIDKIKAEKMDLIDLSSNQLTRIDSIDCKHLKQLFLKNNKLTRLPRLDKLGLHILDVSLNLLKRVPPSPQLFELCVVGNPLTHFPNLRKRAGFRCSSAMPASFINKHYATSCWCCMQNTIELAMINTEPTWDIRQLSRNPLL